MSTSIVEQNGQPGTAVVRTESSGSIAAFASQGNFEAAQRIAKALSASTIVPANYQNNIPNCLVAMELASRIGASVMMVMQNLHVIQGRPSWGAAFLIASVNSCGRFSPIRYEFRGEQGMKTWACRAVARDIASGDVLEGEWITWDMVTAEKWLDKPGSKWKTMPGQMIRYRAASFWVRTYAPEISIGMHSAEEVEDVPPMRGVQSSGTSSLNAALTAIAPTQQDVQDVEAEITSATVSSIDERAPLDEPAAETAPAASTKPVKCAVCFKVGGHESGCPLFD